MSTGSETGRDGATARGCAGRQGSQLVAERDAKDKDRQCNEDHRDDFGRACHDHAEGLQGGEAGRLRQGRDEHARLQGAQGHAPGGGAAAGLLQHRIEAGHPGELPEPEASSEAGSNPPENPRQRHTRAQEHGYSEQTRTVEGDLDTQGLEASGELLHVILLAPSTGGSSAEEARDLARSACGEGPAP